MRALILLTLFWSLHQPTATQANEKANAKTEFDKGVGLFKEERYGEALAAFESSYRLSPKALVLFNIGMCQKALYRFAQALATFDTYLKDSGEAVTEQKRKTVETAVADMKKMVGTLIISDAPDQSTVEVDGLVIGQTPQAAPIVLDPGRHTVRVTKDKFDTLETDVNIDAEARVTLRAALVPAKGTLVVRCDASASVSIDERSVGACPFEGQLAPGTHQVRVSAPLSTPAVETVVLESQQTVTLSLSPVPEPAAFPAQAATPDASSKMQKKISPSSKRNILLPAGAATLAAGLVAGGLGGYFQYRSSVDEQDAKQVIQANEDGNYPDENSYLNAYQDTRDALGVHQAAMIAGYAVGGTLVVAGTVLTIIGVKRRHLNEQSAVSWVGGSLTVRF